MLATTNVASDVVDEFPEATLNREHSRVEGARRRALEFRSERASGRRCPLFLIFNETEAFDCAISDPTLQLRDIVARL
jgi:hypothetical protein